MLFQGVPMIDLRHERVELCSRFRSQHEVSEVVLRVAYFRERPFTLAIHGW